MIVYMEAKSMKNKLKSFISNIKHHISKNKKMNSDLENEGKESNLEKRYKEMFQIIAREFDDDKLASFLLREFEEKCDVDDLNTLDKEVIGKYVKEVASYIKEDFTARKEKCIQLMEDYLKDRGRENPLGTVEEIVMKTNSLLDNMVEDIIYNIDNTYIKRVKLEVLKARELMRYELSQVRPRRRVKRILAENKRRQSEVSKRASGQEKGNKEHWFKIKWF